MLTRALAFGCASVSGLFTVVVNAGGALPPADGTSTIHPLSSFPPQLLTVHECSVFQGRKRHQVHHFKLVPTKG